MPDEEITELPPTFEEEDVEDLKALDEQGIGEGDFDDAEAHEVPKEAIEAYEALEFAYAEQDLEEEVS